ncbi:uncharacterized protein LOC128224462 [Mya arenaria]|nr:uncharacterized protein LOC128224462 [Mya arenaria]
MPLIKRKQALSIALFSLVTLLTITLSLGDAGQEDKDIVNQCDLDDGVANICMQCSMVPIQLDISLDTCCTDKHSFLFCDACLNDRQACEKLLSEIQEVREFTEDQSEPGEEYYYDEDVDDKDQSDVDDNDANKENINVFDEVDPQLDVSKRFGRLFVKSPKRFGRVFFGKRSWDDDSNEINYDKRYGRVFFGKNPKSYFGKRSEYSDSLPYDNFDKRFGRIFMGQKGHRHNYFGKRNFDNLALDNSVPEKRFGQIFMNRGKSLFGKRNNGDQNDLDMLDEEYEGNEQNEYPEKRYGRVYLGGGKFLLGKRGAPYPYNSIGYEHELSPLDGENNDLNMDKRFGRIYMNRMNLFQRRPSHKRYGRLFTG